MSNIPVIFYSALIIITSVVVSLVLFFQLRKNRILIAPTRSFFWHYALGFLIFSLVHVQVFLINLGVQISYPFLATLGVISLFAMLFSYLLFYRGTAFLFTKDWFMTTLFPLIIWPIFACIILFLLAIVKVEFFLILTVVFWGFLFPINIYLGFIFLRLFFKGTPFDTVKRKSHTLLLSFSWFFIFSLDVILWFNLVLYPQEFSILRLAMCKEWFIARAIAHLLILTGFLLYGRDLRHLSIAKKP